MTFGALNNLTFYTSNGSIVGSFSESTHSHATPAFSGSNGSFTAATVTFGSSNGMHFYTTNGSIVGSYTVPAAQTNVAFSADASSTFQTLSFQNSNNVSFSNNAGAIRVTHNLAGTSTGTQGANIGISMTHNSSGLNISATVAAQSNQQMTMFATGNTTQSSTGTTNASSLIFRGDGFVSVGISGGSVVISGTQTNPVVSNAIQLVGSATGSGTNTSRFAADDHVHAGVFSMGVSYRRKYDRRYQSLCRSIRVSRFRYYS